MREQLYLTNLKVSYTHLTDFINFLCGMKTHFSRIIDSEPRIQPTNVELKI